MNFIVHALKLETRLVPQPGWKPQRITVLVLTTIDDCFEWPLPEFPTGDEVRVALATVLRSAQRAEKRRAA